jgi:small subunit ribosomal protein S16
MGAKKQPSYRIVAADSKKPRDGRFIEIVGHYDPKTDPYTLHINEERAQHYLNNGAQPTETVRALLVKKGLLPGYQGTPTAAIKQAEAEKAEEASAEAEAADADEAPADDAEAAEATSEEAAEEEAQS